MVSSIQKQYDVVVVGGGPAGIAAATTAAESGLKVCIVDDNIGLGGQIWRGEGAESLPDAREWSERLRFAGVDINCGARVFGTSDKKSVLAEQGETVYEFGYDKLILATGARERFLPFPGWTLPNVMGAGGLQALAKSGLPIKRKRVVMAGTGPLLLAVAAYLRSHEADVVMICEQASWRSLTWFGIGLLRGRQKLQQALRLRKELSGIPFQANCWPVEARGNEVLEAVVIMQNSKLEAIPCDYLACGFHLAPNTELAQLLGCEVKDDFVCVDEFQQTTVPGIFCAGEPTGIGGLEMSILEGEIAGLAAAEKNSTAHKLFKRKQGMRSFADVLNKTFALRPELRSLPSAETVICRCEDVTYSRLGAQASWRAAKLHTRCGMGPCQGRVCGPATQFLFGWSPDSVRPPIFPAYLENLSVMFSQSGRQHDNQETGGCA